MAPLIKVAVDQSDQTEASENGAELIAFPEVFIPGYPVWLSSNAADVERNKTPINVVLGFSERAQNSVYIAQCIIDKSARVALKRRKMKPTHVERVLFVDGKSGDLGNVTKLSFNNTPNIEHEKIHVSSWPFMHKEGGAFSLQVGGNQILASTYAMQTSSFYLFAAAITTDKIYKKLDKLPELIKAGLGCSAVFAPDGSKISPDLGEDFDGLLHQYLDMNLVVVNKHLIDIVGHYSR